MEEKPKRQESWRVENIPTRGRAQRPEALTAAAARLLAVLGLSSKTPSQKMIDIEVRLCGGEGERGARSTKHPAIDGLTMSALGFFSSHPILILTVSGHESCDVMP